MLLEAAIGDAYGSGFEFKEPGFILIHNDGKTYYPSKFGMGAGQYTDDTQFSMALSELMLSGLPPTNLNLANAFVDTYKRDPRQGYAKGFNLILDTVSNGLEFLATITPHSDKSGGAMRAVPCALFSTPEKVRDKAMWQASLTHATKEGMESAAFVALLGFYARQGNNIEDMARNALKHISFPLDGWGAKRVRNRGYDVGNAVYASLCQKTAYSMSDILMTAVGYGGDTDTVASIALGIISLHPNAIKDLNPSLYDHLEDGDYGIEYLSALDKRLLEAFPKPDLKSDEGKPLSELFVSTDGDIKPFVEL